MTDLQGWASLLSGIGALGISIAALIRSIKADKGVNGTPVYLAQAIAELSTITELMRLREDNEAIRQMLAESHMRQRAIPVGRGRAR